MWKSISLKLPAELQARVEQAVLDAVAEGQYRVAPQRFNKTIPAKERNQFTADVLKELAWMGSREGHAYATRKGKGPLTILSTFIDMSLMRAIEEGFSPLQVLYYGLQAPYGVMGLPDDLRLVLEFIATILDAADEEQRGRMVQVSYLEPEKQKTQYAIDRWLKTVEGEYWKGGLYRTDQKWVHFMQQEDADTFRAKLLELKVTLIDNPERVADDD
jgi:hypothetical protein